MDICELNILSVYLKKWSYHDNRINLSFSFFTDAGYGRSAVDMRINNPQIMVNEFLNNVVYRTKEYFTNMEHGYAKASIKIMSDSSVKGKMQGFFMKMVKEYNNNKRSRGKSRMISNRSMDFFYNDFEHLPWHIKNIYLSIYYQLGLVGLLLFALMLYKLIKINRDDILTSAFQIFLLSYITGIFAFGLFGDPFDSARTSVIFFMLLFSFQLMTPKKE